VGELNDRRARKKAQTRELIRGVAHRMFEERGFDGVTIADIAGEADVAVQTVFNHFATKEELFFDGRVPWVDGPANAVRNRPAGVSPLTALREYLVERAAHVVARHVTPEGQSFTAAVSACPALSAYEQRIITLAERQLACALAEAWATDPEPGPGSSLVRAAPAIAAPLTAAIWLATHRVVVVEQRRAPELRADPSAATGAVRRLADDILAGIQTQLGLALPTGGEQATGPTDTGWPQADIRRAG
jgi:AcrR family transcriptional regulator